MANRYATIRYLAPFRPVMPLLELDGARLWKAEAQNAHELTVERFRRFFVRKKPGYRC